jgi:hypothetical protein
MNLKRLEFVVTYRCNSHCKHCQVDESRRHLLPQAIDAQLAAGIVRSIAREHPLTSVMTFGGEPLLYLDAVCAIHQAAMDCGIPARQIITNAGFPPTKSLAERVAQRLSASGVNEMCISVDAFHQEYIPLEVVERNVRAYLAAGITELAWNPCWVVAPEADNPYDRRTRSILQELSHLPVRAGTGNLLQPAGSAQQYLKAYFPPKQLIPQGSCEDRPYTSRLDEIDSISIAPDGGVDICSDWMIGNARETDILDILRAYEPTAIPEVHAILSGGMAALVELARSRGVETDAQGYWSICAMCVDLRNKIHSLAER